MKSLEGKVRELMSRKRWDHTRGVITTALKLAAVHYPGLESRRVQTAALLHDLAKDLPLGVLLKKAGDFGIVLTSSDLCCPQVLHGPVGAGISEHYFGIEDQEILRAIYLHTTAGPKMSPLERIIFLADSIEPERTFPWAEHLRSLARQDLDKALLTCIDLTLIHLLRRGRYVHPRMVAARNSMLVAGTVPDLPGEE